MRVRVRVGVGVTVRARVRVRVRPERPLPTRTRNLRAAAPDLEPRCSQTGALRPYRAACYALLRGRAPRASGLGNRLLDVVAEVATGALLLPTATLGALIRLVLRLCGRERWVQFGPPPGTAKANTTA